jgi:hypothetical protein
VQVRRNARLAELTTLGVGGPIDRLGPEVHGLEVVGLEIDPERVAAVAADRDPPRVDFRVGGFELAGLRPVLVRAFNVLRQYDEESAAQAWQTMCAALGPGGLLVEGTCDEWGRRSAWVALDADGPLTLTLSARVSDLDEPSDLAERLPKALIHHNVPGQPVHEFLRALDTAWATAAGLSTFGPRQRWTAAVEALAEQGWPFVGSSRRWRHGEVTAGRRGGRSARRPGRDPPHASPADLHLLAGGRTNLPQRPREVFRSATVRTCGATQSDCGGGGAGRTMHWLTHGPRP